MHNLKDSINHNICNNNYIVGHLRLLNFMIYPVYGTRKEHLLGEAIVMILANKMSQHQVQTNIYYLKPFKRRKETVSQWV